MSHRTMQIKRLYRVPILAILVGQCTLFLILAGAGALGPIVLRSSLNPILIFFLVIALGTSIFISITFIRQYINSPNRLKLNVLIALISLAATLTFFLINFIYTAIVANPASAISKGYVIDAGTVMFLVMAYHFVLFGIDVLISPTTEIRINMAKVLLDIILLTAYFLNFASYIVELSASYDLAELLNDVGDSLAYVLYILCGLYLVIMIMKSIALQRKATDPRGKAGFRSWAVTFLLIMVDILLILLFSLMEEISTNQAELVIFFGIGLLVATTACSYFVYKGFIAPASTRQS